MGGTTDFVKTLRQASLGLQSRVNFTIEGYKDEQLGGLLLAL